MKSISLYLKLILSIGLIFFFFGQSFLPGQPVAQFGQHQLVKEKSSNESVKPGPVNLKEKTAILVFLGWMWLVIAILIYLLIQKIREVDRLYEIKYYDVSSHGQEK
ncbi:MAG: hypothetical protein B5M54_04990 [Candidatus Aminicenantes bacterium 4484_214]|nr:hypothetical protein [Candidatus Aminicenantes bacterium]OQX54502.1 MAG: hypothetical protein B5M54_04990 [Candidatus Aminicenantes bacterium 4484_214]